MKDFLKRLFDRVRCFLLVFTARAKIIPKHGMSPYRGWTDVEVQSLKRVLLEDQYGHRRTFESSILEEEFQAELRRQWRNWFGPGPYFVQVWDGGINPARTLIFTEEVSTRKVVETRRKRR
jgi:hypothetical protein